jgi:alkanesulfonate monooxygenase SsuD/methylene tetrahydromethanopterin reductase-like flavin-dependent oxidoreductase (luciferase family)
MQVRGRAFRFGIQLIPQRVTWPEYAAALQAVERLDFDTVWAFDHLLPYCGPDGDACFETLTTLGAIAALTTRVRIGVLVNGVLYRDPATLAKCAATADQISGGRLEFSLGAAYARREFETYGLPYPPLAERYERLDEALHIVKSLWTQTRTTFEGRHHRVENAPCEPKPLQLPHPPIMVGGSGDSALRIAAKHATSANLYGSAERIAERAALLKSFCSEFGRDFDEIELSVHGDLALGTTHADAEAMAARVAAAQGSDLDSQRDSWIIGTPDEAVDQLRRYAEAGISHWILHLNAPFDLTLLELLRDAVVPAFR